MLTLYFYILHSVTSASYKPKHLFIQDEMMREYKWNEDMGEMIISSFHSVIYTPT